jgi:hypothetical protein
MVMTIPMASNEHINVSSTIALLASHHAMNSIAALFYEFSPLFRLGPVFYVNSLIGAMKF